MNEQLVKKNRVGYQKVYPLNFIENIIDTESHKSLKDILLSYNHLYIPSEGTIKDIRVKVPNLMRRFGLWISYEYNNELVTEFFKGNTIEVSNDEYWVDDANWELVPNIKMIHDDGMKIPNGAILPDMLSPELKQLIETSGNTIVNMADDEDLTSESGALKLKDKEYHPEIASGMGTKILRKNWINGRNILTKDMISKPNTIYIIKYDFDLDNQEIEMPENCVLKFEGGSINESNPIYNKYGYQTNGKIIGNCTLISGSLTNIFNNIILEGSYKNLECNLIWWGVKRGISITDNVDRIQCAFDSKIPIVNISEEYCITKPIRLAYNKKIQGRTGNNNKLTGFYASDNFKSQSVNFPERLIAGKVKPEFTQEVYGMFYHRDTTKSEIHDIYIDARFKSDFCVEHIDAYGSIDFYNCHITRARECGILQYACENPIIDQLYITECNIGYYISYNKYNRDNPLDFTGVAMGNPNIASFKNLRCLMCNYGCIIHNVSDVELDKFETAYNYLKGAVFDRTNVIILQGYSEGDAIHDKYLQKDGSVLKSADTGHTLQYLIDSNLDGRELGDGYHKDKVRWRCPYDIIESNINIKSAFYSYKPRSYEIKNVTKFEEPSIRESAGIDSIFFNKDSNFNIDGLSLYLWNEGGRTCLYSFMYVTAKQNYLSLPNITINSDISSITYPLWVMQPAFLSPNEIKYNISILRGSTYPSFNTNMEERLYGKQTYKTKFIANTYKDSYKDVPLYKYDTTQTGWSSYLFFTKKQIKEIFGNRRQIVVRKVYKVIQDVDKAQTSINFIFTKDENSITPISTSSVCINTQAMKKGYYEIIGVVTIEKEIDYGSVIMQLSSIGSDSYIQSDIYIYDIGDMNFETPIYRYVYPQQGTTEQRPKEPQIGWHYFDTNIKSNIIWNGKEWIHSDGSPADAPHSGSDASKPTGVADGFMYKATDTNKIYVYLGGTWNDITPNPPAA